jgi:hypothetical protein
MNCFESVEGVCEEVFDKMEDGEEVDDIAERNRWKAHNL